MSNFLENLKDLKINLAIDQNVPKYVFVDYIRLKQILINLLSNAVKFTEEGAIDLSVSVFEYINEHKIEAREDQAEIKIYQIQEL